MNLIQKLQNQITVPKWLPDNVQYLTLMGSEAYGAGQPGSDRDVYGFAIPPRNDVFPHLAGHIEGFGQQRLRFDSWQQHHIQVLDTVYDITVYGIVKYFALCMECNPNMLDSLFSSQAVVMTQTSIGQMVREKRKLFLSKAYWHRAKGFAYSQLHKMDATKRENPDRQESIDKFGYDVKFGYHVVRVLLQCEQVLTEGDLDLTRNAEVIKAIRRGEWSKERVKEFFAEKEKALEVLYDNSDLPWLAREEEIKTLLLNCLEAHYGTLPIARLNEAEACLAKVTQILQDYNKL